MICSQCNSYFALVDVVKVSSGQSCSLSHKKNNRNESRQREIFRVSKTFVTSVRKAPKHFWKTFQLNKSNSNAYWEKKVIDSKKIIADSLSVGLTWFIHQLKMFHWTGSLTLSKYYLSIGWLEHLISKGKCGLGGAEVIFRGHLLRVYHAS